MPPSDDANTSPRRPALIIADLQPDFMPGGALAVAGGDEVISGIADLVQRTAIPVIVATQDWHPRGHISFASSHAGHKPLEKIDLYGHEQVLWPDHCVQGTPGAELHREFPLHRVSAIVRKGADPSCDAYSAFRDNWNREGKRPPTGLAGYLRERSVGDVYVCGLARDYCCAWTALDAADAGFRTFFLWELTRAVDPAGDGALRAELIRPGIEIVARDEVP